MNDIDVDMPWKTMLLQKDYSHLIVGRPEDDKDISRPHATLHCIAWYLCTRDADLPNAKSVLVSLHSENPVDTQNCGRS